MRPRLVSEIGLMAETTEKTTDKKLSVAGPKATLSLKGRGVEQGVVRQSFSHGRSKAVVVEKVKSRAPTRAKAEAPLGAKKPTALKPAAQAGAVPSPAVAPTQPAAPKPSGVVLRPLTA